ncbi:MAG: hypothetical protein D6759_16245 [Chloroflexi bacterium]|nr:MAG: hypothetical protein D6759_16245 [Chloroflexota bacterium]
MTDVDWIEWRRGNPVAVIECRRAMHGDSAEDAIAHFKRLNRGFQFEVLCRLSFELRVPGYIVGIEDPDPDQHTYQGARFVIEEVVPPETWPKGRLDLGSIETRRIGEFDEQEYAQFLARLGGRPATQGKRG